MSKIHPVRLLIILGVGLLLLLVLLLALLASDTFLSFHAHLREAPDWLAWLLLAGLSGLSMLVGFVFLRMLRPQRVTTRSTSVQSPPSRAQLDARLQAARDAQLDITHAEAELVTLEQRRAAGTVHLAFFGDISSGKSSLIKALLPEAEARVHVTGGTTQEVLEYQWTSQAGDRLVLSDMPGLNEPGRGHEPQVRAEALRAHLVVFVCEGDLTRSQMDELQQLAALQKPLFIALNKMDRLSTDDLERVKARIGEQVEKFGQVEIVPISAGGTTQVVRILPDGSERMEIRQRPPEVQALAQAIQRHIDADPGALEHLRDSAVFVLVSRQLDQALLAHRMGEADKLVASYAKKALLGAIAAMTPGSDLVIQGYLASQMVRELSNLFEVPLRKLDVELLLKLVQQHVKGHSTLLLAIAGNGLKAFPGVGTLAGGVLHAIAYGTLFEALGRGVAASLASRGELHPIQAANQVKESLREDLRASAQHFAKMALEEIRRSGRDSSAH